LLESFRCYLARIGEWQFLVEALIPHYLSDKYLTRLGVGTNACRQLDRVPKQVAMLLNWFARTETNPEILIASSVLMIKTLAARMKTAISAIKEFDQKIAELCANHRDYHLFAALPGSGTVYSSRLLAAFGTDRERFESAAVLLSEVPAPVLPRVCRRVDQAFVLGPRLLCGTESEGEESSGSRQSAGVQVD